MSFVFLNSYIYLGDYMNIVNNIKEFLYNKQYFINFYENYIHLYNFQEIESISSGEINVKFAQFRMIITGLNFVVARLENNEMLIKGKINKAEYHYYE